jgi:hypothetical protein
MKRTPVDSTSVMSVGYEPASRILEVEFHGGRVYRYFDVPPRRYRGLLDAESAGRFLNTEIKGVYSYIQIRPR